MSIGDGERIAVLAVTHAEVSFEIGAPHLIGREYLRARLAGMPYVTSLGFFG
jgi:hypothetical protein